MKTASGHEYEFIPPSARPVDLGERLCPVIQKWVEDGNIMKGDGGFMVLVIMDNPLESVHRIRVNEAQAMRYMARNKEDRRTKGMLLGTALDNAKEGGFKQRVRSFFRREQ